MSSHERLQGQGAMRARRRWGCAAGIALLLGAAGAPAALAGEADRAEIEALLEFVGSSGCDFVRNGIHHRPEDAREHLEMKLARAGDRVETAEDFVRYVATGSSITGRPYGVACPGQETRESRDWLLAELERLRKARKTAPAAD